MKLDLEERLRVGNGASFDLATRDCANAGALHKGQAKLLLYKRLARLRDLQENLFAQGRTALLIILQGMDASGKDGIVSHVLAGINPQGCQVTSFKGPSPLELRHDFLWRCACALPERGRIGVFNRSYYEEVVTVRVHRDLLAKQMLPPALVTDDIWEERFASIREFEKHLVRNGTRVLKFFLHISRGEQRKRLLARIDDPAKNWKFDPGDLKERACWDGYMHAYDAAISQTSTLDAPWYVVPADRKWFARLAVADIVSSHLERLDPQPPQLGAEAENALAEARRELQENAQERSETAHRSGPP